MNWGVLQKLPLQTATLTNLRTCGPHVPNVGSALAYPLFDDQDTYRKRLVHQCRVDKFEALWSVGCRLNGFDRTLLDGGLLRVVVFNRGGR
jgi:hypothetical protein